MATIVFVHGTGTRNLALNTSYGHARVELLRRQPEGLTIEACAWGDAVGFRLQGAGASIPDFASTRDAGVLGLGDADEEAESALWALLYEDPLAELRLLSAAGEEEPETLPGPDAPGK